MSVSSRDELKALKIIAGPLVELDSNCRKAGGGGSTRWWRRSARQEATNVSHACNFVAVAAAARVRRSSKSHFGRILLRRLSSSGFVFLSSTLGAERSPCEKGIRMAGRNRDGLMHATAPGSVQHATVFRYLPDRTRGLAPT